MKVLFDIIYSTQPDKCSSASKFKKIALQLLAAQAFVAADPRFNDLISLSNSIET